MDPIAHRSCPECNIGRLALHSVDLFKVHDQKPIWIPNHPAWVCDICGYCEYDLHTLANFNRVTSQARALHLRTSTLSPAAETDTPQNAGDTSKRR